MVDLNERRLEKEHQIGGATFMLVSKTVSTKIWEYKALDALHVKMLVYVAQYLSAQLSHEFKPKERNYHSDSNFLWQRGYLGWYLSSTRPKSMVSE